MEKPIKISIVNYTNTVPFVYGIKHFFSEEEIDLQLDIPSVCAQKFAEGKVDIGLIPAAIIKKISSNNYFEKIISSFCIGSEGKVDSVMLYSEVPLSQIKTIVLDYQSRTSVELVKILCRELWNITPQFNRGEVGFENTIAGTQAAVIIGDRTFALKNKYKFQFDLAKGWKELTGMPFVFACWVTNKELTESFLKKFDTALRFGYENIESALKNSSIQHLTQAETRFYLEKRLSYPFDQPKKDALKRFLDYLS